MRISVCDAFGVKKKTGATDSLKSIGEKPELMWKELSMFSNILYIWLMVLCPVAHVLVTC